MHGDTFFPPLILAMLEWGRRSPYCWLLKQYIHMYNIDMAVINNSITVNGEIPLLNAVEVTLSTSWLPEHRQLLQDLAQDP